MNDKNREADRRNSLSARCPVLVALLLAFCLSGLAQQSDKKPESPKQVDLMWAVKIPMRDGERLNASVYRPPAQK